MLIILVITKVVFRFCPVFGIVGSHDGSSCVRAAPDVNTTSTFYRYVLRFHRVDLVFQLGCKSLPHFVTFVS